MKCGAYFIGARPISLGSAEREKKIFLSATPARHREPLHSARAHGREQARRAGLRLHGVNINEASRSPAAARDRVFRRRRIKTCPYYLLLADQPIAMMREKHHSCVLPDGNPILFEKFSKISVYNRCLKASDPFKKSKRTAGV